MSTKVGQLTIEMAANVVRLEKDMAQARRSVETTMSKIQKSADTAMRSLGALGIGLSVGAFASWVKGAIDAIDKLAKLSSATGIAIEELSGLDYAAKLSGTSLESLTQASNKLQLGLATNSAALKSVGISAQDPVEALIELANVYAATEGQSNRAAIANMALGKSWQGLAGFLAQGGDSIRALMDEGAALSGVTKQTAKDAEQFNDAIDTLRTRINALALNIAGPLLSAFSNVIDQLNEGTRAAGGFWKAIGLLGTTNPFATLEDQVQKYRKEVEDLTAQQTKYGELASIAFNVNDKLAQATQRLAYFEQMLAIETRKAAQARAEGSSGANAHALAYNAMISSADELVAKMEEEFSLIGLTNEQRAVSIALRKLEELGIRAGSEAFEKYLSEINEIQRRIGVKREMVRLSDEAGKAAKREAEEYSRLVETLKEKIATIEMENQTFGLTNRERERSIFLRELENVKIQDRNALLEKYDEATLIKEANALREKGIEDRLKQEEEFSRQVQKINDQIGQSLTDALMDGGRSAKDFLISMFKTIVLRPLLQPIISGAVGAMGFGSTGAALAGTGESGGGASSLMSIGGALKSAYELVTTGFTSIGTSVTSAASKIGMSMSMAGEAGGAMATAGESLLASASSLGAVASYLGGIGAGLGLGNLISGGKSVGGSSWLTVGGGTAIGALVGGPLGAAIGGIIGGVINAAFGSGAKEYTDSGVSGTFTAMSADIEEYAKWKKAGGWFVSTKRGTEFTALNSDLQNTLDASLRGIGGAVSLFAQSLGQPTDAINTFSQSINISFKDLSEQEIQQKMQEAVAGFESGLINAVFPALQTFAYAGETQGETLKRLSERLSAVNQVFSALEFKLNEISMSGASAANTLIELVGGIESFVQKVDFYYQNFYTVQERLNKNTDQLTQVFAQLGMALPTTREAFRAVMDIFQQAGSPELVATLLNSAGAFNEYITALEETEAKAKELADLRMQERMSLETQLFQLLGMTAELRRRELETLDESNRGLQQHIYSLQDAQDAYDAAAAATQEAIEQLKEAEEFAAEIKARRQQESASIENKLFQLLGQVSILRSRETSTLDESNRALQQHVYSLEDAQAAFSGAVSSVNKAFDQLKQSISVELEAALDSLTKDFDSLTESLTQQQEALKIASQIANENLNGLSRVFDLLGRHIDDLVGTTRQTVMEGMSFIKTALSTARTTGYLPEQEELAGAIEAARGGLSSDNFGSAFEMRRANLLLANDLSALRSIAGSQMTDAQTQIAVAEQQLEALKARLEQARTQYEDSINSTNSYYEAQLIAAQQQINVLNGINESVLSVGAATNNLAVAMGEQRAATVALANANAAALIAAQQAAARREAELAAAKAAADEKARIAEAAAAAAAASAAERARQEEAARVALAQANAAAAAAALQAAANREAALVAAKAAADEKARLAEAAAQAEAAAAAERARQQEAARVAAAAAEAERQRLATAAAASQAAADASRNASIAQLYREILGREPDAAGLQYWMGSGESIASIRNNILLNKQAQDEAWSANNSWYAGDGAATGGYVSPGMMLVGEEGPELVNFRSPGMVYNSAQTESLLGGSGGENIIGELRSMREDQRAQAKAVVALQSRMTRVIERWEGDGLPSTRYEGATA